MLTIATDLPPGALIGGDEELVAQAVLKSGGARFVARASDLIRDDGRILGWREARGAGDAMAATPNTGNSRFEAGPPAALVCETGVNCGFVLPEFAREVEQFTVAMIYSSGGEARTLAAVSTGQANNVIFLNESGGRLYLKDRSNAVEASLPVASAARPKLVIASFDGRSLRLRMEGREAVGEGRVPDMKHKADFLIGCRSNRAGLTKTLGEALLHEVMFWPDHALSETGAAEDAQVLSALERYHRWAW
jgi:hypothetical protein